MTQSKRAGDVQHVGGKLPAVRGKLYRCARCKTEKLAGEFYPRNRKAGDLDCYCIPCRKEVHKAWRQKNGLYSHIRRYGMSSSDFNSLMDKQNNRCAICDAEPPERRRLSVDHDHASGRVRGLLCDPCNRGLGQFNDDVVKLQAALEYLKGTSWLMD